jgi:hypothetical protein
MSEERKEIVERLLDTIVQRGSEKAGSSAMKAWRTAMVGWLLPDGNVAFDAATAVGWSDVVNELSLLQAAIDRGNFVSSLPSTFTARKIADYIFTRQTTQDQHVVRVCDDWLPPAMIGRINVKRECRTCFLA